MENSNKIYPSTIILIGAVIIVIAVFGITKLNTYKRMQQINENNNEDTTLITTIDDNNSTTTTEQIDTTTTTISTTSTSIKVINNTNETTKSTTSTTTKATVRTTKSTSTTTSTTTKKTEAQTTVPDATQQLINEAKQKYQQNMSLNNELLSYVNALRTEQGVNTLTMDNNLCIAATMRAIEIANSGKFLHTRPDGREPQTVLKDLNVSYRMFGENLAYSTGAMSPQLAYNSWYNSPGHYQNMIDSDFTKMGAGKAVDSSGKTYWVQLFK